MVCARQKVPSRGFRFVRHGLTFLAGLCIVILMAALIAPPLINWESQRAFVDDVVSGTIGMPVRSEGRIDVRLLPSPKIKLEKLMLAEKVAQRSFITAHNMRAEIALMPLLKGEIRLVDMTVMRTDIGLLHDANGTINTPLVLHNGLNHLAFEQLLMGEVRVALRDTTSGETDELRFSHLRVETPSLQGPWKIEGFLGDQVPFRLLTAEVSHQNDLAFKMFGGGGTKARFEVDARLSGALDKQAGFSPRLTGQLKLTGGPPAQSDAMPLMLQTQFEWSGLDVKLADVAMEAGQGAQALKMTGAGRVDWRKSHIHLTLSAPYFDLEGFMQSPDGMALKASSLPRGLLLDYPVSYDFDLANIKLKNDILPSVKARLTHIDQTVTLHNLEIEGQAGARVSFSGKALMGAHPSLAGDVRITAPEGAFIREMTDHLAGFFGYNKEHDIAALFPHHAFEASGQVNLAFPILSLRAARLTSADMTWTGQMRLTLADGQNPPRMDAQITAQNIDLARLTPLFALWGGLPPFDFGLALDLRDVRVGDQPQDQGGRIAARMTAQNGALQVGALEISNVAGGKGTLSGAITQGGEGRLKGSFEATHAQGLITLLEGFPRAKKALSFLPLPPRESLIAVAMTAERKSAAASSLDVHIEGKAFGGEIKVRSTHNSSEKKGGLDHLTFNLDIADLGHWLSQPHMKGAARIELEGAKADQGHFDLSLTAKASDIELKTIHPLNLDDHNGVPHIAVSRLSLPWMISTFGTGAVAAKEDMALWPAARFEAMPPLWNEAQAHLKMADFDIGHGWSAKAGEMNITIRPDSVAFTHIKAPLIEGRLAGNLTINRNGAQIIVSGDVSAEQLGLNQIMPPSAAMNGVLSGQMRIGTTGESPATLIANLAGGGEGRLSQLILANLDAGGLSRAATRALSEKDPLALRRLEALVGEEIMRGPFAATKEARFPISMNGGAARLSPITFDSASGQWRGQVHVDVKTLMAEMKGSLSAAQAPKGWSGAMPFIALNWRGPFAALARESDASPLINGLAALLLRRELQTIEAFDAAAQERKRARAPIERRSNPSVDNDAAAETSGLAPALPPPVEVPSAPKIEASP
jgi:hypothetical protein